VVIELMNSEAKRARMQSPPTSPKQLPNEIILSILEFLKLDDDLPSLAAVVRANKNMYNLAIPKLYETVTVTERNQYNIGYGYTPDGESDREVK
jgi:hypothetical protein